MAGTHRHHCATKGCPATFTCSDEYLQRDPDGSGTYCTAHPLDDELCEDCWEAERAADDRAEAEQEADDDRR